MMEVGTELRSITRKMEQADITAYAEASGDFNPIHIDEEFARSTRFGGTIAHGMMVAAMLSELMATEFACNWTNTGQLKIRFRSPVKPGDTVTAHGEVSRVREEADGAKITCSVGIRTDKGESAITGNAMVIVSKIDAE
jgi:3-hydroxybutyryl-CoA dehydratase